MSYYSVVIAPPEKPPISIYFHITPFAGNCGYDILSGDSGYNLYNGNYINNGRNKDLDLITKIWFRAVCSAFKVRRRIVMSETIGDIDSNLALRMIYVNKLDESSAVAKNSFLTHTLKTWEPRDGGTILSWFSPWEYSNGYKKFEPLEVPDESRLKGATVKLVEHTDDENNPEVELWSMQL